MPYFGEGVSPSMNPSGVQLRRFAIHGFARHTHPKVLIKYLYCMQNCILTLLSKAKQSKAKQSKAKQSKSKNDNCQKTAADLPIAT